MSRAIVWNPGVADFLRSLGAGEDVIAFIEAAGDPKLQGRLANEVRKNPKITVSELAQFLESLPGKREPTSQEIGRQHITMMRARQRGLPGWQALGDWVMIQLMKHRARPGRSKFYPEETEFYEYKGSMLDVTSVPTFNLYNVDASDMFGDRVEGIIDWLYATNERIANYSWDEAVEAAQAWHTECAVAGGDLSYEPQDPALVMYVFKDGWKIVRIATHNDFTVEGNRMGHCVESYYQSAKDGNTSIFSLRDPMNRPHATIEMTNLKAPIVEQVKGRGNAEPKPAYRAKVAEWFASMQPPPFARGDFEKTKHECRRENSASPEILRAFEQDLSGEYGTLVWPTDTVDNVLSRIGSALFSEQPRDRRWNDSFTQKLATLIGEWLFTLDVSSNRTKTTPRKWFKAGNRADEWNTLIILRESALDTINREIEQSEFHDRHYMEIDAEEPQEYDYENEYGKDWEEPFTRARERWVKESTQQWQRYWADSEPAFWEMAMLAYMEKMGKVFGVDPKSLVSEDFRWVAHKL